MQKLVAFCLLLVCVLTFTQGAFAADSKGAAPNSGDGESDGSGMDTQDGPKGSGDGEPAPNSGDGIPDGSGK